MWMRVDKSSGWQEWEGGRGPFGRGFCFCLGVFFILVLVFVDFDVDLDFVFVFVFVFGLGVFATSGSTTAPEKTSAIIPSPMFSAGSQVSLDSS